MESCGTYISISSHSISESFVGYFMWSTQVPIAIDCFIRVYVNNPLPKMIVVLENINAYNAIVLNMHNFWGPDTY